MAAHRGIRVGNGHIQQLHQPFGVVGCLEDFQLIAALDVFQQLTFFFDSCILAGFDGLGAGHGFLGFGTLQGPPAFHIVHFHGIVPKFSALGSVGPLGLFPGSFLQPGDFLF